MTTPLADGLPHPYQTATFDYPHRTGQYSVVWCTPGSKLNPRLTKYALKVITLESNTSAHLPDTPSGRSKIHAEQLK